jgi:hypothetical protein
MIDQIQIYKDQIQVILNKERIWELSDKVLYDMCQKHPYHNDPKEIIMKTLIIGRVYSVQLERRKNKDNLLGDKFYEDKVIKTFLESGLDERLSRLTSKNLSPESFDEIFQTHKFLMDKIHPITELNKRSFCSKYLHFHKPELFFLYDSRLRQSLSILKGKIHQEQRTQFLVNTSYYDIEYVEFFLKCYNLKIELERVLEQSLSIRDFDTIMLELSNNINDKTR